MLGLKAGKEQLDLIPQPGSTLHDATIKAGAVDAGTGSAEEFAAAKATGKVAVVTRSDEVSASRAGGERARRRAPWPCSS